MMLPVSPREVYLIHEQKVKELERELEFIRIAKEQHGAQMGGSLLQRQAWYAQAAQWVKALLFNRAPVSVRASSQTERFEEPCPGVPC